MRYAFNFFFLVVGVVLGRWEGWMYMFLLQKQLHGYCLLILFHFFFQSAVLSVLGGLSAVGKVTGMTPNMLISVKSHLKKLLVSCLLRLPFFYFS